jgi:hypothetical protein
MTAAIPETNTSSTRASRASLYFWIAAFLLAGLFAARNLSTWSVRISYPGDESYEGVALLEISHLRRGIPIYAAGATQSFNEATYGPLYYILGSQLVNPSRPSYLPLRILSLIGMLGCAAGCGVLAYWLSQSRPASFLSAIVFLAYGMVTGHGITALSDSIALFLFFTGFLVAYKFRHGNTILFAAPFMVLGFYYKPQYIAGPIAVFVFLILEKRYRRAMLFTAVMTIGVLGLFAYFQWVVFSGEAFWRHFLLYQGSLMSWYRFNQGLLIFALLLAAPYLLGIDYLRSYPSKLLACYGACAVLLGLVTISKDGSDVHYFFEGVLFVSAVVPALIARRMMPRQQPFELLALLAAILFLGQWYTPTAPKPQDFESYQRLQTYLTRHFAAGTKALDASPGDMLQAGFQVPFTSPYQLSHLARRGIVSDDGLVTQIRVRQFSLIALNFDLENEHDQSLLDFFLTGPMRDAIERNYSISFSLEAPEPERFRGQNRIYFYVPKNTGSFQRVIVIEKGGGERAPAAPDR